MTEEVVKPLVDIREKHQLETLAQLVQEDRERRLEEEVRTKGSCVTERKTWRKRV